MVLCTATVGSLRDVDFLPLTVDIEERMYAAGKIPGSFFRREGKSSEKATLTARMIDRPIRPLFPKGWHYETQLVAIPMSVDQVHPYDILAMNGASAALAISGSGGRSSARCESASSTAISSSTPPGGPRRARSRPDRRRHRKAILIVRAAPAVSSRRSSTARIAHSRSEARRRVGSCSRRPAKGRGQRPQSTRACSAYPLFHGQALVDAIATEASSALGRSTRSRRDSSPVPRGDEDAGRPQAEVAAAFDSIEGL
jgi:hypothetical protein